MTIKYQGFEFEKLIDEHRLTVLNNKPDFLTKQGILNTFIINMDISTERLKEIIEKCNKAGITNLTRLRAFNGNEELENMERELPEFAVNTDDQKLKENVKFLKDIGYDNKYGKGEQGCASSHLYLWKYIVQHKLPSALIIEDDAYFHQYFATLFTKAWEKRPKDGTLFNFVHAYDEIHSSCINKQLEWVKYAQYATCCYVITYEGASQLLEKYSRKTFPKIIPIIDDVPFATHETSYKLHYDNKYVFKNKGDRNCGIVSAPMANNNDSTINKINGNKINGNKINGNKYRCIYVIIGGTILIFLVFVLLFYVIYKNG